MATFDELGYAVALHGDGRWNGVAIAPRLGLANVERGFSAEQRAERPP
jgi:exodeoxyribonuclease-3